MRTGKITISLLIFAFVIAPFVGFVLLLNHAQAIRVTNTVIQNVASVTSTTIPYNVNTSRNSMLEFQVGFSGNNGVAVSGTTKYAGIALTTTTNVNVFTNGSPTINSFSIVSYRMVSPPIGSSSVSITFSSAITNAWFVVRTYEGVNQATPIVSSSSVQGTSPTSLNTTPTNDWSWFSSFGLSANSGVSQGNVTPLNGQLLTNTGTGFVFGYKPYQRIGTQADGYSWNACATCSESAYAINPDGLSSRLTIRGSSLLIRGSKLLIK